MFFNVLGMFFNVLGINFDILVTVSVSGCTASL